MCRLSPVYSGMSAAGDRAGKQAYNETRTEEIDRNNTEKEEQYFTGRVATHGFLSCFPYECFFLISIHLADNMVQYIQCN